MTAPTGTVRRAPSAAVLGEGPRLGWLARSALAGAGAATLGALLWPLLGRTKGTGAARAGERLFQGAALLSFSVLADSALEHYRARFRNRAMFAAPTMAGLTLAAACLGNSQRRAPLTRAIFLGAGVTGAVGGGFHIWNIGKREGGFAWVNLFYAAPIGAPGALAVAGGCGLVALRLGDGPAPRPLWFGLPTGRTLALGGAGALLAVSAEVWLLHFRGAFQNPFMYAPVTVPPLAALALGASAAAPAAGLIAATRALLAATALAGFAGVGFHAYGIARNMGGWRNWSQMLFQGPPLPAPPSITGLAVAGLGALRLLEAPHD